MGGPRKHWNEALSSYKEEVILEDSLIKNLQQQIQYLEMELDLQRKASGIPQSPTFNSTPEDTGEISGRTSSGSIVRPLDETIKQLRLAFIHKEKEYKEEIGALKEQLEQITSKDKSDQLKVEQLKRDYLQSQSHYQQVLREEKEKLIKEITELERSMEEKEKQVVSSALKCREWETVISQYTQNNVNMQGQLTLLEEKMKHAEKVIRQMEEKNVILQKQCDDQRMETLAMTRQHDEMRETSTLVKSDLEEAKKRAIECEISEKRTYMEKLQLEGVKEKLEEHLKKLNETSVNQAQEIQRLTRYLGVAQDSMKQIQQSERDLMNQLMQYEARESNNKLQLEQMESMNCAITAKNAELEKRISQELAGREQHTAQVRQLERNLDTEKQDKDGDKQRCHAALENQRQVIEQNKDLQAQLSVLSKQNVQLEMSLCESKVQVDVLTRQVQANKLLSELQRGEWGDWLRNNMQFAEKVQELSHVVFQATNNHSSQGDSNHNIQGDNKNSILVEPGQRSTTNSSEPLQRQVRTGYGIPMEQGEKEHTAHSPSNNVQEHTAHSPSNKARHMSYKEWIQ